MAVAKQCGNPMGTTHFAGSETGARDRFAFSHPREVIASPGMPEDQKRRILLDWLQDELALLVADNEGMVGEEPPRPDIVLEGLLVLSAGQEAWQRSTRSARPSFSPHTGPAGATSFPSG